MPFFKLDDLPGAVVAPGHSTAYGPTITGNELEIGCRTARECMPTGKIRTMRDGVCAMNEFPERKVWDFSMI